MAINQFWVNSLILVLTIYLYLIKSSSACDLVPSNDGSCLELSATPYITFQTSLFGPNIEGTSVNQDGDMFAVNYGTSATLYQLGQFFPHQRLFYSDSNTISAFNGIRFLNSETALVADYKMHRVLKLTVGPENLITNTENYCSDVNMIQPNDLAVSKTGTVFTSGMNWIPDTYDTDGDIWSCLPDGNATRLGLMGRTNGIELSPDERYLYVSESFNRNDVPIAQYIWRYDTNISAGTISGGQLFANFTSIDNTAEFDIVGIKTDVNGNIYVTRHRASHVTIFSAQGVLIGKIAVNFPRPTNLEFGGPNGTTLFIVGECALEGRGCVDQIEVAVPGRSWSMLQASSGCSIQIRNYLQIVVMMVFLGLFIVRKL